MITQAESGLTPEQYEAYKNATTGGRYTVTAYRYNPIFGVIYSGISTDVVSFDSALIGTLIVTALPESAKLRRYNISTGIVEEVALPVPSNYNGQVSIVQNGTMLQVFMGASDGIYVTNNAEGTPNGPYLAVSCSDPILSCPSAAKIDYIDRVTNDLWYLKRCEWVNSVGWQTEASEIFLTRRPFSMASVEDASTGLTVIAVSTLRPGLSTARYIDNSVVKQIKRSEGIIGFTYKSHQWSDHYNIDVLDNATDWRWRRHIKMSLMHGKFYLTAVSSDSEKADYAIQSIRLYTTKDGTYWSSGEIMPSMSNYAGVGGVRLIQYGTTLYGAQSVYLHSAPSTMQFGASAASEMLDLSPHIIEYISSATEGRQSSLLLSNEDGYFDTTFITDPDVVIMLEHKWGYDQIGSIVVAIEEVDAITRNESLSSYTLQLVARDRLSWLSDRSQSETAVYRQSQLWGGDQYHDTTNTSAGGLAHTATIVGTWKTRNGELYTAKKDAESIAFSTFDTDLTDGQFEIGFTLSKLNNDEYAGICFRAIDDKNMWYYAFKQATDSIVLVERRAGVDTIQASISNVGWSNDLNTYWLKVVFKYGKIVGWVSANSIDWALAIEYYMQGNPLIDDEESEASELPLERGYVGYIAKGFSPEEVFDDDIPDYIDIPWTWPDPGDTSIDDKRWTVKIDEDVSAPQAGGIILSVSDQGKVYLCTNFYADAHTYKEVTPPGLSSTAKCYHAIFDYRKPFSKAAYVLWFDEEENTSGVCYTPDIFAKKLIWRNGEGVRGIYQYMRLTEYASGLYIYTSGSTFEELDPETLNLCEYNLYKWYIPNITVLGYTSAAAQIGEPFCMFHSRFQYHISGFTAYWSIQIRKDFPSPKFVKQIKITVNHQAPSTTGFKWRVNDGEWTTPTQYTDGDAVYTFNIQDEIKYIHIMGETYEYSIFGIQLVQLKKIEVVYGEEHMHGEADGAATAFSSNNGKTWRKPVRIGASSVVDTGGDVARRGYGAYFTSKNDLNLTTIYGGKYKPVLYRSEANIVAVAVPWIRIGSNTRNYGPTPDVYIATDNVSDDQRLLYLKGTQMTGITPPSPEPTGFVGTGPNSIMAWGGGIIYVIMQVSGSQHRYVCKSVNAGETWDVVHQLDNSSTAYIRIPKYTGTAQRIFATNHETICYSPDAGVTWIDKDHPDKVISVEVYG